MQTLCAASMRGKVMIQCNLLRVWNGFWRLNVFLREAALCLGIIIWYATCAHILSSDRVSFRNLADIGYTFDLLSCWYAPSFWFPSYLCMNFHSFSIIVKKKKKEFVGVLHSSHYSPAQLLWIFVGLNK